MTNLNKYLNFLQKEQAAVVGTALKAMKPIIFRSARDAGLFAGASASAMAGIKSLKLALSGAARKCGAGVLRKESPGVKICIAKEQIKNYQQQINVYQNLLSKCNGHKKPEECKEKITIKIEKLKNKILINQARVKQYSGVEEQMQMISKLPAIALGLATMVAADKAIFLLNRTTIAAFNKEARKCGIYKEGNARNLCIAKSKLKILNEKLAKLKGILNNCSKQRNQEKCREKVNKLIERTNQQIQITRDSEMSYKNQLDTEKREERLRAALKSKEE